MIHKTAIIDKKAELAEGVSVGPYTFIGKNVTIGANTKIGNNCVIDGNTTIGKNCTIFTGAVIGSITQDKKYKGQKSFLKIGNNNVIREYVTINLGTQEGSITSISNDNLFMAYSHIAHDCNIGNGVVIANSGTLAGYVTVEDKATVGGLVAVHQYVKIGSLSIIGGCSKVVQDIVPYAMVDGHPTRIYGINTTGLARARVCEDIKNNLKKAFKILFHSGLSIPHALEKIQKDIPKSEQINHLIEFIKSSQRGIAR